MNESSEDRYPHALQKPITLRTLRRMRRENERFAMLTCYDATTARWLMRAGVHTLLVGDSAAQMILGHESTIHAPLDFMIELTAAVKRGAPHCFVVGDMPFMTYQTEIAEAMRNAGRFLTRGHADAVKLEVQAEDAELVHRLSLAGVAVVAHLGSLPQHIKHTGGYRTVGRTAEEGWSLLEQAEMMAQAGASMLLLEAVPAEVAQLVVERVSIPVIGCGAGTNCAGHVVVLQDLLGLSDWQPSFAPPLADLKSPLCDAARKWVELLQSGEYLKDHPYPMHNGEADRLRSLK